MKNEKLIYPLLILVVVLWGTNVVTVKYLADHMEPLMVGSIRMLIASLFFGLILWRQGWYKPKRYEWVLIIVVGFFSYFIHQITLVYGMHMTSATNGSLILGLNPVMIAFLAAIFLNEKITLNLIFGLVLALAGVFMVVTNGAGGQLQLSGAGDAVMVLAMLTYAVASIFVKKAVGIGIPTLAVTAYATMMGTAMLNVFTVFTLGPSAYSQINVSATAWTAIFISAVGSTALATLMYNYAMKVIGAGKSALFLNGIPFAGALGGVLIFHERLGWLHLFAFLLTTAGIVIASKKRREMARQPSQAA